VPCWTGTVSRKDAKVPDYRLCCRTILLNPFLRFVYWQMNYHTEHHTYALVPCYNLGKLHTHIKTDLPHCPVGLCETWGQLSEILKQQQVDPLYRYVPELPIRPVS
jgi:fatty acid desaturase